jgi:hypothetical protein
MRKTLALDVYPDISLAKARRRHPQTRERLVEGMDPVLEMPKPEKTFEEVARERYSCWKTRRNERHTVYVIRRLEADVAWEPRNVPEGEKREARGALGASRESFVAG